MKLASLKAGGRDGTLVVVDRDLQRAVTVQNIAPTLQSALDRWSECESRLRSVYGSLNDGKAQKAFTLDTSTLAAPLPRAYQWLDGSAYLTHVERVRRARGAELPPSLRSDPLMYQGCSDGFLAHGDPIVAISDEWGIDFEGEVAVVTDDVPMGVSPASADDHIVLLMLANDVSLRALIPEELTKGFGFVHGKPASAFSPVAVTPDEVGEFWHCGKLHRPLVVHFNGEFFGNPEAGVDMHFNFPALVSHAAKTRALGAGTIIGSGTVSNRDPARGYACILERRMVEKVEDGRSSTEFMRFGDRVRIEMLDEHGRSIFGAIDHIVSSPEAGP